MFAFFGNIVIINVQSGLKLYNFTILAAGVEAEQDCNPFAQRLLSSCACLIELKTEFELEQIISMQLRNRITVVRNVRIHHLSLLKARHKTQLFSV